MRILPDIDVSYYCIDHTFPLPSVSLEKCVIY